MEPQISEQKDTPIRVLIVDDHVILRQGICIMLNEEDDFEVVGDTGNGKAALMLALELQPDIVLLDIFLGTSNGLDVANSCSGAVLTHALCCSVASMMKI